MAKKQKHNNQPVAGNVWERPRPVGGHGSGPLWPRPEFSWGGSVGLPKAAPPSLLGQIKPIRAQTTIRWRDRTLGGTRDRAGGHGSDPLCPLFDFGRVVHRSPGPRKATKTLKTTINCQWNARESSRTMVRGALIQKKVIK